MTTTSKDSRRPGEVATAETQHHDLPEDAQDQQDGRRSTEKAVDGTEAPSESPSLAQRVQALLAWWKTTRLARALTRYGQVNGALLCGGIAYSAIFSVFAGLTIGFTVFMRFLGNNDELLDSVIDSVNTALPGMLQTTPGKAETGLIDPESLVTSTSLSVASIVSVVVLLVSAISCMGAVQVAVRAMFGLPPGVGNPVLVKVRQLGGFVVIGLAVLASAVIGIVVGSVSSWLLDLLGLEGTGRYLLPVLGLLVAFLVDVGTFVLIVRLLSAVHPARRDLLLGAVVAAVGFGVIRFLGTSVVASSASTNPVLTSFAAIITLLIWINLSARILLTAAAISADLPLELLEKVSDVEAAEQAIERARSGEADPVTAAEGRRAEVQVASVTVGRRLLTLAAAGVGGYLLGRRRG